MRIVIVIPARHGSTRLPGKPLAMIAGRTMLRRVTDIAKKAASDLGDAEVLVATDHQGILEHCRELSVAAVMTPEDCATGTDRVEAAVRQLKEEPALVLNLQGDAPLTPPDFVAAVIVALRDGNCDIATPVTQLSWQALDRLREAKKTTPLSGTTAVFDDRTGRAHWFSKNVIPAIAKEERMRAAGAMSPVWRHVGLYGYTRKALAAYVALPKGRFEEIEGLEQLRAVENGMTVRCVPVDYGGRASMSGVDSPEDVARAEELIRRHGELTA